MFKIESTVKRTFELRVVQVAEEVVYADGSGGHGHPVPADTGRAATATDIAAALQADDTMRALVLDALGPSDAERHIEKVALEERRRRIELEEVGTFVWALRQVRQGRRVARSGWNGKAMWIALQAGYPNGIPINRNTAEATGIPEGTVCRFLPYIMMRTADGSFVPWLASQTDLLAADWCAVDISANGSEADTPNGCAVGPLTAAFSSRLNRQSGRQQ